LPPDIRSKDVKDLFYNYGKFAVLGLKNRKGPPFAFVEFEVSRDAEDAVYTRDGYDYNGYRLRVEFLKGGGGSFRGARVGSGGRGPPAKRSQHKATQPGGKLKTSPKPRERCHPNAAPSTKSSLQTEQLIEFEDNLETKNIPPPLPLTMEEI
jgi:RNA recognition motif-containing protein